MTDVAAKAWSLETYDLVLSVHAHKESVLGLYLSDDGNLLFSSGGDSVINVSITSRRKKKKKLD
jgi:WD40 repeat protein